MTLTLPPSANELFCNVRNKGRAKTKKYRDWLNLSAPLVARLKPPEKYPATFFYMLVGKVNLSRDGDNLQKPLLDCCVQADVIPQDNLRCIRGGCWHYEESAAEPHVIIWFEAML